MNKNENNLSQNISDMKDEIQKSLKKIELLQVLYNKENDNENENEFNELNYEEIKTKNKPRAKKNIIHVTYFIPVLQFLDIKSIIELSKVNHLFYSFIYSFYFYRSVNQILIHTNQNRLNKNKKDDIFNKKKLKQINQNNKDIIIKKNSQDEDNMFLGPTKKIYSSFMSAITGALSYIAPIPELPTTHKEKKNDLEEIQKKINLHEKLLNERIKQLAISNEIKNTRAKIDKYIKEQYDMKKNHQKKNELNKNKNNNIKINDQTIKKIKREKYESEYNALLQEINNYENEYNNLKKDNEKQGKLNIDLEIKLNKIKYYAKNKFKVDENL